MAYGSGLSAQLGFINEGTYGTRTVPTKFPEFISETLSGNYGRIESNALRAGTRTARSDRWAVGPKDVNGTVVMEMQNKGLGLLLKHALGACATSQPSVGTDPTVYEHKCTMADQTGLGLTVQVGRPTNAAVVQPWDYVGCKITSLKLSGAVGAIPQLEVTFYGQDEKTDQTLATASYPAGLAVLTWAGTTVTIGGTNYPCQSAALTVTNAFKTDRYNLGALTRSEPILNGKSTVGIDLTSEYVDNTAYARITGGTTAAVTMLFDGAVISHAYVFGIEVTMPCVRFDSDNPQVSGPDVLSQPLKGIALDDASADAPIKIVYRTTDATP